jgi:tRNA-specific 2-thiouridylase
VPVRFDGEAVQFDQPEYGVSTGQAAVLDDGDRLLGGNWIEETVPPELEPA